MVRRGRRRGCSHGLARTGACSTRTCQQGSRTEAVLTAPLHRVRKVALLFPSTDTLRLALTSALVPEVVSVAPAQARFGDDGRIWVEPSIPVDAAAKKQLSRIGVQ